jgi:hypothetical protein
MLALAQHTYRQIVVAVGLNLLASVKQVLHLFRPPFVALMARSLRQYQSLALSNAWDVNQVEFTQQRSLQQLSA